MRGNKPGTLTHLQKRQKQDSRNKVITAAIELFAQKSFVGTSVDDIIKLADISRMTFYRHFPSKLDVASSILEHYTELLIDDYASLGSTSNPTRKNITDWIRRIINIWRESRSNMMVLASLLRQDSELITHRRHTYERTIVRLGETIPAFAVAAEKKDDDARIRAHLLLTELEDLCYEITISGWDVDEDLAIEIVSEHFWQFIKSRKKAVVR